MGLKKILSIAFAILVSIPLIADLLYLHAHTEKEYRSLVAEKLATVSAINKRSILESIHRIDDNAKLIASRTQMRINLAEWQRSGRAETLVFTKRIIQDAKNTVKTISHIDLYDRSGEWVVSTTDKTSELALQKNHVDQPIRFSQAQSGTGEILISHISELRLKGELIGYIQISFFDTFVRELVEDRSGLMETGEWLIAKRRSNGDALFIAPLKYEPDAAFRSTVGRNQLEVPITQAFLGNEMIMEYATDYAGNAVFASTRYIKELDVGLVAKIHESEVKDRLNEAFEEVIYGDLMIVIAALLAGFMVAIGISNPIEGLIRHIRRSSEQKRLEVYVDASKYSWNESKELINAYNDMTEQLSTVMDEKRQAIEALEKSNSDLDQFAHAISHDLKEPLRTLIMFTEYLMKDLKEDDQKRVEQDTLFIRQAACRSNNMVNGLLSLTRVTNEPFSEKSFRLEKLLEETCGCLSSLIHNRKAKVMWTDELPEIVGDWAKLSSVFQNLISNAVKFQREGVDPEVIIESSILDSQHVKISVKDNGVGIEEKLIPQMFQPFRRCHDTEKYEGTGIGLPLTKKILDRYDSTIEVYSTVGQGTEVSFTLPKKEEKLVANMRM